MYSIIVCPKWFPNKYSELDAIYTKRHLEIIAETNRVLVAFAKGHYSEPDKYKIYRSKENGLEIIICYYKLSKIQYFNKIINFFRLINAQKKAIFKCLKLTDKVDFFHIHVLTSSAIIPIFFFFLRKIPFFISEHSTAFLNHNSGFIHQIRVWAQIQLSKRSSGISAVSNSLKKAMENRGLKNRNFKIIPNLIDDDFFFYKPCNESSTNIKFLHVSRLDQNAKNILGIITVFSKVINKYNNVELHIVGGTSACVSSVKSFIKCVKLKESTFFYGNINKERLRDIYQNVDYFVTFSNYETQAIVNLEALMCGLPVIATKLPALEEYLHFGNSLLVNPKDETGLYNSIETCIKREMKFWSREDISNDIKKKFNRNNIKHSFEEFYKEGLK